MAVALVVAVLSALIVPGSAAASPAASRETAIGRLAASGPWKSDPFSSRATARLRGARLRGAVSSRARRAAHTRGGASAGSTGSKRGRKGVRRRGRAAQPPVVPTATVTQTTANLSDALTAKRPRVWVTAPTPGSQVIKVNGQIQYQRIIGFGAAMTDSSAYLLQDQLTPTDRTIAMQALFGQAGIHLDFVRIPIGASDFSATGVPYSYDDVPAGQTDPTLAAFSTAHDDAYILPALQEMLAQNPDIVTYANPWSPPAWMKANDSLSNLSGAGKVLPQFYPALAQYFVKFLQSYAAAGVPIDDISVQNEPHSGSTWPTTDFVVQDQIPFVANHLLPALSAAGLHPQLYGPEETVNPTDQQALFTSPVAADYSGASFHCYGGMGGFTTFHEQFPTVPILMTECSPGIIRYSAAEAAIDATDNWASVATLWNLALDPQGGPVQPPNSGCRGCTGVIRVNEQTHQAFYGHNYFEFGQISSFVAPGAVRIFSTRYVADDGKTVTPGVDNVAFINPDGTKVLVAYNSATTAIPISIEWRRHYVNYLVAPGATVTFTWQ